MKQSPAMRGFSIRRPALLPSRFESGWISATVEEEKPMQRRSIFALALGASIAFATEVARAQSLDWKTIADKDGRHSLEMPKGYRVARRSR